MEELIIKRKQKSGAYLDENAIRDCIYYASGLSKSKKAKTHYTGGRGLIHTNADMAVCCMKAVKKNCRKRRKKERQISHWIISFPEEMDDITIAVFCAWSLADYFYQQGYQSYFGIHEDTENLHIHLIVNTASFIDGKQFHISKQETQKMINDMKWQCRLIMEDNGYC